MRKRLLYLTALSVISVMLMGAARYEMVFKNVGDVTIDSQIGGNWEPVDSLVAVFDSASNATIIVTGIALMDAWDKLYVGFGNDSANRVDSATSATTGQTNANLDTVLVAAGGMAAGGKRRVPFSVTYVASFTAVTDTFYLNVATGGSSSPEKVQLEDVFFVLEMGGKP